MCRSFRSRFACVFAFVFACIFGLMSPNALRAEDTEGEDVFVDSTVISILFHEVGHALFDLLALPVAGQEETAADVAAVLLIDRFFDTEEASGIVFDTAVWHQTEHETTREMGRKVPYWEAHGPDLQRNYAMTCLFYGGDPERRIELVEALELPAEVTADCVHDHTKAIETWGPILAGITAKTPGTSFVYAGGVNTVLQQTVAREVAALNWAFALPAPLAVKVASCGAANAAYDPEAKTITLCTELEPYLRGLYHGEN